MNYRYLIIVFTVAMVFVRPASGEAVQDHRSIRTTAETFITGIVRSSHGSEPEVKAGALDSRLRLSACSNPLEAFQPTGSRMLGNTTVGVRCPGDTPWTLYVPVRVSLFDDIIVAARPVARNSLLQRNDLKISRRDLAQLHAGYYSDIEQLIGKQVARNISINEAITTPLVKNPLAVKRGQRVSLVASTGGIEVRMAGEALADGATGERIKVRNLNSKRIIDGVVLTASIIQVAM